MRRDVASGEGKVGGGWRGRVRTKEEQEREERKRRTGIWGRRAGERRRERNGWAAGLAGRRRAAPNVRGPSRPSAPSTPSARRWTAAAEPLAPNFDVPDRPPPPLLTSLESFIRSAASRPTARITRNPDGRHRRAEPGRRPPFFRLSDANDAETACGAHRCTTGDDAAAAGRAAVWDARAWPRTAGHDLPSPRVADWAPRRTFGGAAQVGPAYSRGSW